MLLFAFWFTTIRLVLSLRKNLHIRFKEPRSISLVGTEIAQIIWRRWWVMKASLKTHPAHSVRGSPYWNFLWTWWFHSSGLCWPQIKQDCHSFSPQHPLFLVIGKTVLGREAGSGLAAACDVEWYLLPRLAVEVRNAWGSPGSTSGQYTWYSLDPGFLCCPNPIQQPLSWIGPLKFGGHAQIFFLIFGHQYLKIKRFYTCIRIGFSASLENLWRAGNTSPSRNNHLEKARVLPQLAPVPWVKR